MVDVKNMLDIESQSAKYLYKLDKLEAKRRRTINQLEDLQNNCPHDFVLYFGEENAPIRPDAYAVCTCCRKGFFFSELDQYNTEGLSQKNLISVMTYLERGLGKDLDLETLNIKALLNRAQEKIISIGVLDPEIPTDALKEEIKNDLLSFMLEQETLKRVRK